jgi:hypothetical protein
MDRLRQALVCLLTGRGRTVVQEQVEADSEAIAVEQNPVEPRVNCSSSNIGS